LAGHFTATNMMAASSNTKDIAVNGVVDWNMYPIFEINIALSF
jgi:hypothetical protein